MHEHLVRAVVAELGRPATGVTLADVGCGDGAFLRTAHEYLPRLLPGGVDLWGFDVCDRGVQETEDFLAEAVTRLLEAAPHVDWGNRISSIRSHDPWPYGDESIDVVTSNQVGEHVRDLDRFLRENFRVLRPGGVGVHVFPLKGYVAEGHVGLPWVHRLRSWDGRRSYLRWAPRLGLQRFGPRRWDGVQPLGEYAVAGADYVTFETNYRTWAQVEAAARHAGLRASYRHTSALYLLKLGSFVGWDLPSLYRIRWPMPLQWVGFKLFSRLSSITLVVERPGPR
ncbi:MAG: class I SAM-dependent methyltransferase [Acidimicrobiales bacterium]